MTPAAMLLDIVERTDKPLRWIAKRIGAHPFQVRYWEAGHETMAPDMKRRIQALWRGVQ